MARAASAVAAGLRGAGLGASTTQPWPEYAPLHRALIAGLPTQIGHRVEKGLYEAPRQRKFQLFPGSTAGQAAAGLVAGGDLLDTQKIWGLMGARDRAGLGHRRAAAPAVAPPFRSALVARAGPGDRLGADQPVRPGAGAEEAGALRRAVSGRVARIFVRQGLLTGEINTRAAFRRAQSLHAGKGARGRSQAAPRRPGRRRGLAGALVPGPPAAGHQFACRGWTAGTASCRRKNAGRWNGRWPTCCRARAARSIASRNISRWAISGWRCITASSPARPMTA